MNLEDIKIGDIIEFTYPEDENLRIYRMKVYGTLNDDERLRGPWQQLDITGHILYEYPYEDVLSSHSRFITCYLLPNLIF